VRLTLLTTNLARGGAETQVAQLALRLRARGHDVSVVSLLPVTAFADELTAHGVRVAAPGLAHLLPQLRTLRPEVLHCHMFHANIVGRLLRLVLPVPVVISTLHSIAESPRISQRYWPRAYAYRLTQPLANRTVAVFNPLGIPNGVDTREFHPPLQPAVNSQFTWLAAGRLMWKKDYPTLLRAMAELPEARLLIAGTGPDEAVLRTLAPRNVEFVGVREDIAELMRSVDAFVLSSVVEGLPLVLLEAAATGLPIVATDVGGVRLVQPARLVPPGDWKALAKAMREMMADPPDRGAIRAYAVEHFEWDTVVDQWEALYRDLRPWM
jgi:glycosyltransferase involved in cell wall biosynthesis